MISSDNLIQSRHRHRTGHCACARQTVHAEVPPLFSRSFNAAMRLPPPVAGYSHLEHGHPIVGYTWEGGSPFPRLADRRCYPEEAPGARDYHGWPIPRRVIPAAGGMAAAIKAARSLQERGTTLSAQDSRKATREIRMRTNNFIGERPA